jgi:amino acid transporter
MFSPAVSVWPGILSIVAIAPWAFVGFDAIPQAAEEFNFSPKKTFKIMVFAILVGAFLYIACQYDNGDGLSLD